MRNLINKEYLPLDNSYAVNMTDSSIKWSCLAGTHGTMAEMTLIVSNPFKMIVKTSVGTFEERTMILVKDFNNHTHAVLFFPFRVVTKENKQEMIELNEKQALEERENQLW